MRASSRRAARSCGANSPAIACASRARPCFICAARSTRDGWAGRPVFLFCSAEGPLLALRSMSNVPPPNDALAELAAVLGEDNVRTLVRTFLRDFPVSLRDLGGGDRKQRHRLAHSMKSNSRLMGAMNLSQRMAAIEQRL